jgi:hypothetical protein
MLLDAELMLKGFNVCGSFYNTVAQNVATEGSIVFTNQLNVNNILWDPLKPEEIVINEDGVYKLFFLCTTSISAQLTIFVNGVPDLGTTQGTNKGAGQLTIRDLHNLKKGDIVTIRNHTSANGGIILTEFAGGFVPSLSALLTVFKIAPSPAALPVVECKLNKYHHRCYNMFKEYLLHKKCLQVNGSGAYFASTMDTRLTVSTNEAFIFNNNVLINDVYHTQGTTEFKIKEDGLYDLFADIATNEPSQIAVFVNGLPDLTTVSGRDSGAARNILRQIINLKKDDVISVRNYQSHAISLTSAANAGGHLVGQNAVFMAFKLAPMMECPPPCPPVCPPKPCEKPKRN